MQHAHHSKWRIPRVLIVLNTAAGWAREVVRGVVRFQTRMRRFELMYVSDYQNTDRRNAMLDEADAVLTIIDTREWRVRLQESGKPVVLVGICRPDFHTVTADEVVVGKLAFEHLRSLRLTEFGYVGAYHSETFDRRSQGFDAAASAGGFKVRAHEMRFDEFSNAALGKWLESLPKPIGVFAQNANIARRVTDTCRRRNIIVPEQVAVLGVDRDEIECNLCLPTLSSIDHAMDEAGYLAADVLNRMLSGEQVQERSLFVQPRGVITAGSTKVTYVNDPDVATAVRFIHAHAAGGIAVGDVVEATLIARRKLERAFRRELGRTIHEEILRVRIERVCELLRSTNMNLQEIAHACGFSSPIRLHEAFRRSMQQTPTTFRKLSRQARQEPTEG
jgi:LacI family transcriptional regulator